MILKVKVHPGAGKIQVNGENVVVFTEKPMKNNMANYDIMKQISDFYHVEVNCVSILRGATRRNKLIEVRCI
ncbi:DUF167 domain-containing protein [Cuniculiplasma divulgatum]|jgi:uncharacterized protein YggU (UPF0235/DUF167 family)|uniref:DUF167 domain-containing protein n=1 Tax=Cuniculiplasma divulgatum TaxID=1673428 RepID=A0A1R4A8V4_9ARCH|nr:DUF167 family protein [Cuniculiplasma divulgatum]MCI2412718.1 DUF167 family protein [Cuniculiplasma sp.]SJK85388.1 hypothetical protein CPM_1601 [Cuniculiplasma divulgatum]